MSNEINDLRERAIALIDEVVVAHRKFSWLEARTGVKSQKWTMLYHRKQLLTGEMIVGLSKVAPHRLEWLVTGHAGSLQTAKEDDLESIKQVIWLKMKDELDAQAKLDAEDIKLLIASQSSTEKNGN